jgi:enoyl-CoA hydratase/carnithine racemase
MRCGYVHDCPESAELRHRVEELEKALSAARQAAEAQTAAAKAARESAERAWALSLKETRYTKG